MAACESLARRCGGYPYGDMTYARAAPGEFLANRGVLDALVAPLDNTSQYNLPCTIPPEGATLSTLNPYIDSARRDGAWRILLFHGFIGGHDGAYHAVLLSDFIANVNYVKSLGDLWLDTMVNVTSYWVGQKLLASASPIASTNGSELVHSWTLPAPFPPGKCLRVSVDGGTVKQRSTALPWVEHGYYEISLDAGSLSLSLQKHVSCVRQSMRAEPRSAILRWALRTRRHAANRAPDAGLTAEPIMGDARGGCRAERSAHGLLARDAAEGLYGRG